MTSMSRPPFALAWLPPATRVGERKERLRALDPEARLPVAVGVVVEQPEARGALHLDAVPPVVGGEALGEVRVGRAHELDAGAAARARHDGAEHGEPRRAAREQSLRDAVSSSVTSLTRTSREPSMRMPWPARVPDTSQSTTCTSPPAADADRRARAGDLEVQQLRAAGVLHRHARRGTLDRERVELHVVGASIETTAPRLVVPRARADRRDPPPQHETVACIPMRTAPAYVPAARGPYRRHRPHRRLPGSSRDRRGR
jgi:hypothetical protein